MARLRTTPWQPKKKIEYLQEKKLYLLLRYAYLNVGYYHDLFNSARINLSPGSALEELKNVPLTTKQNLISAGIDKIFSNPQKMNRCIKKFTSGSSGEPFEIYLRKKDYDALAALTIRNYKINGLGLYSRRIEIGSPDTIEGGESIFNKLGFWRTRNLSVHLKMEDMSGLINAYRPDAIVAYPSALKQLCQYIIDNKINIFKPRCLFCRSEFLDAETRVLAKRAFGVDIFDFFGCWEIGLFAFECKEHLGYHLSQDACLTEFIGINGKAAAEGEISRIVCTNFYSYAMPFVRYDIGDMGSYSSEPCRCGIRFPRLSRIMGRADDCIVLRSGEKVLPSTVILSFKDILGISKYRIVQEDTANLTVSLQLSEQQKNEPHGIVQKVASNMHQIFRGKINVRVEISDYLKSNAGEKYKSIISKINQGFN